MKTSGHFHFSSPLHLTEYFSYYELISNGYPYSFRLFRLVPNIELLSIAYYRFHGRPLLKTCRELQSLTSPFEDQVLLINQPIPQVALINIIIYY